MRRSVRKLRLSKETLHGLDRDVIAGPETSCIDSCYLVSCGGGCGISTEIKTA